MPHRHVLATITGDNAAANASAIAALPDLIEALTVLVERIDQWSHDNPGNAGMYHTMTAEARQALRTTKGLTP